MRRSLGAEKKRASASQDASSSSSTSLPSTPRSVTIDSFFPKQTAPAHIAPSAHPPSSQPSSPSQTAFTRLQLFVAATRGDSVSALTAVALQPAVQESVAAAASHPSSSPSSVSAQLAAPTRSSSQTRRPLLPLNVAPRPAAAHRRKRRLSSDVSVKLSSRHTAALPADDPEVSDNSAFSFPAPSFLPTTRHSLSAAPRKRITASRRGSSEGDSRTRAKAARAVDSVDSPAGSASASPSPSLCPPARSGVTAFQDESEREHDGAWGVRLDFASQGSHETAGVQEEEEERSVIIVSDSSQEEKRTMEEEEGDERPTQLLPASPDLTATAPPPLLPPAALPAQAAVAPSRSFSSLSITRCPSNGFMQPAHPPPAAGGRPLGRSSSIASAASSQSQSQGSGCCTPLDQPVKLRTDEQRTMDLLTARQRLHQPSSASALATVSVNTFLPFPQRHSAPPSSAASASSAAAACSSSRLLSDFAVQRTEGGDSVRSVLRCRHRLDGCLYAVKRISTVSSSASASPPWGCGRLREVWALAALTAAGSVPASLCRYYGSWYEDNQLHIVTDWCEGATLRSLLDDGGCRAWGEQELVLLLRQLAQALQHLHALGIAHLDVRPDRILLCTAASAASPSSSSLQCKLMDFGLATPLSSQPQRLSGLGDRRYLPQYAVEHEDAAEAVQRIDSFMLGMTALEAAKGAQLTEEERSRAREGRTQGIVLRGVDGTERLSDDVLAVLDGLLCSDMWERWGAEDVLRRLAERDEAECERRRMEQQMRTAVAEAERWRERALAAEKEREGCSARLSQLERYVQQVQTHMARLQQ